MAQLDLPLEDLRGYRPDRHEPPDFDAFWARTLAESRAATFPARFEPFDAGLTSVDVFHVTFAGFGGDPIKGWPLVPPARQARLPCVVEYLGYGRGRGHPLEWLSWVSLNFAVRATAPALFCAGLMDLICPPSTVFGAFNHYVGAKRISVWPYNGPDGGGVEHLLERIEFLRELWPRSDGGPTRG